MRNKGLFCSLMLHLFIASQFNLDKLVELKPKTLIIDIVKNKHTASKGTHRQLPIGNKHSNDKIPVAVLPTSSVVKQYTDELQSELDNPLTAKSFIYSGYFERISIAIRPGWVKQIRPLVRSEKRLLSVVQIIIDRTGLVLSTALVYESGRPEIDTAALAAIKIGNMYPNPPKGIIDQDGFGRIYWRFEIN